ncbi:hypothetical protein GCM10010266_26450 [Streptomyces griseomycini]|nr:hypothetical protein GCM10010266_26450 [Streptomyces griseomycini]GGR11168.1 hypothetical protein GCM10015536_15690 [Streptomyces griseomycini]
MRAGERFVASGAGSAAIRCATLVVPRPRPEAQAGAGVPRRTGEAGPAPGAMCVRDDAGTVVTVRFTCGEDPP